MPRKVVRGAQQLSPAEDRTRGRLSIKQCFPGCCLAVPQLGCARWQWDQLVFLKVQVPAPGGGSEGRANDSGAGPKGIRKRFVSIPAALPGWRGECCWWLGAAAESGFLLGRSGAGVALESSTKTNEPRGLQGWMAAGRPSWPSVSAVLASRFWHASGCCPSVLLSLRVPAPRSRLLAVRVQISDMTAFLAPGSRSIDHKLVTLCRDAS